jgi:hypothetical protein
MKRLRETLARLDKLDKVESSLRLDKVGRTSSVRTTSERVFVGSDGQGPIVLADNIPDGEEGIDIIFVHGLQGHRVGSFTKGAVCWPRDLLGHDVPASRIVSWGHGGPLGSSGAVFADQAEKLLTDIARIRVGTSRPIIFIGHGLGGLIVKEALVTAAMSRIYGSQ